MAALGRPGGLAGVGLGTRPGIGSGPGPDALSHPHTGGRWAHLVCRPAGRHPMAGGRHQRPDGGRTAGVEQPGPQRNHRPRANPAFGLCRPCAAHAHFGADGHAHGAPPHPHPSSRGRHHLRVALSGRQRQRPLRRGGRTPAGRRRGGPHQPRRHRLTDRDHQREKAHLLRKNT